MLDMCPRGVDEGMILDGTLSKIFSSSLLVARYHPVLHSLTTYNYTIDAHLPYTYASID
jgi:hypothetical protein